MVREFDNLHRSFLRTQPGSVRELDVGARLAQFNHHPVFPTQFGNMASRAFFIRS